MNIRDTYGKFDTVIICEILQLLTKTQKLQYAHKCARMIESCWILCYKFFQRSYKYIKDYLFLHNLLTKFNTLHFFQCFRNHVLVLSPTSSWTSFTRKWPVSSSPTGKLSTNPGSPSEDHIASTSKRLRRCTDDKAKIGHLNGGEARDGPKLGL